VVGSEDVLGEAVEALIHRGVVIPGDQDFGDEHGGIAPQLDVAVLADHLVLGLFLEADPHDAGDGFDHFLEG